MPAVDLQYCIVSFIILLLTRLHVVELKNDTARTAFRKMF